MEGYKMINFSKKILFSFLLTTTFICFTEQQVNAMDRSKALKKQARLKEEKKKRKYDREHPITPLQAITNSIMVEPAIEQKDASQSDDTESPRTESPQNTDDSALGNSIGWLDKIGCQITNTCSGLYNLGAYLCKAGTKKICECISPEITAKALAVGAVGLAIGTGTWAAIPLAKALGIASYSGITFLACVNSSAGLGIILKIFPNKDIDKKNVATQIANSASHYFASSTTLPIAVASGINKPLGNFLVSPIIPKLRLALQITAAILSTIDYDSAIEKQIVGEQQFNRMKTKFSGSFYLLVGLTVACVTVQANQCIHTVYIPEILASTISATAASLTVNLSKMTYESLYPYLKKQICSMIYNKVYRNTASNKQPFCIICEQNLEDGDIIYAFIPCQNAAHKDCYKNNPITTCPNCSKEIEAKEIFIYENNE